MEFPPTKGHIVFEGLASSKFWVRVFNLEPYVAFAQAKLDEMPQRNCAAVPIINQHEVSPELTFFYAIELTVDTLGVRDGIGCVFFAGKVHAAAAIDARNQLADKILKALIKKGAEDVESHFIAQGREPA